MKNHQADKPDTLLAHKHLINSGEPSQPLLRPRRTRSGIPSTGNQNGQTLLSLRKVISYKKATPSKKSDRLETSSHGRKTRTPKMAPGAALSSISAPRLTKTGRVSKAKKGLRGAHRCGCGKEYSRAEHLRRHQQNHEKQLPCPVPSCGKNFHRQDLFERHIATRHNQQSGSQSRQGSPSSTNPTSATRTRSDVSGDESFQSPAASVADSVDVTTTYLDVPTNDQSALFKTASDDRASPTSQSESSYLPTVKAESYPPHPFSSWIGLDQPATNTATSYPFAAQSPYPSSGHVSPFNSNTFSSPWLDTTSLYPQTTSLDSISFAFNSSTIASPRTLSAPSQLPIWMDNNDLPAVFPTSLASSPSSSCAPMLAPVMVPQNPSRVPYPLAYVGQHDKYGALDIESPLEEQQLGICLSLKTKQHYVEAYWANFHPVFPVLHKPTHKSMATNPLLTAAIMAIGAQYTDEQYAKGDSRILHDKCLELVAKYKDTLSTTSRIDYMQAIFLVEIFAHFKAKRAASQLSDVFVAVYGNLFKRHANTGRSWIESLGSLQPHLDDKSVSFHWSEWVAAVAYERLLTACYIFETTQALLLARPLHSASTDGFALLMPESTYLWDASSPSRWVSAIRANPPKIIDVAQTLDNMWHNECHVQRFEPFQCAILTACHAASVLTQKQEMLSAPFAPATASHHVFEVENIGILGRFFCPEANVIIMHNLVRLASTTPMRAILATSGESWVLSQRLSQEALLAAAEYTSLKADMRAWTQSSEQPPIFQSAAPEGARLAVQHALNILKVCLDADVSTLVFGSDMALYYACLILWAVTFSAVSKAEAAGFKFESDDTAEFEAPRAAHDAKLFCDFAEADMHSAMVTGCISADRVDGWRFSVGAVLRWSAWALGDAGMRSNGVGELMEGAVVVLERLGRRGWCGEWF